MRPILAIVFVAVMFGGCLSAKPSQSDVNAASVPPAGPAPPQLLKWNGHIFTPAMTRLAHTQPSETVVFPLHQEGFIFDVMEAPRAMEIRLDWKGAPDAVFWLNPHFMKSHKNGTVSAPPVYDDGSTNILNYHTNASSKTPQCLRIPEADLQAGMWETMIHMSPQTSGAAAGTVMPGDFSITIGLDGGMAHIMKDELHGHKDTAIFEEHGSGACTMLVGTLPSS